MAKFQPLPTLQLARLHFDTRAGAVQKVGAWISETQGNMSEDDEARMDPAEGLIQVKRAMLEAHRGLEKMEKHGLGFGSIRKEVWQIYQRLRAVEEKERVLDHDAKRDLEETALHVGSRVVKAHLAVQTPSVDGNDSDDGYESDDSDKDDVSDPYEGEMSEEKWQEYVKNRRLSICGDVAGYSLDPDDYSSYQSSSDDDAEAGAVEEVDDTETHPTVAVSMPRAALRITGGHYVPNGARLSAISEDEPLPRTPSPKTVYSPCSPCEVVDNIMEEESQASLTINDLDAERYGSANGPSIANAIMSGSNDWHLFVPKLESIKLHEVKALYQWMTARGHLGRSAEITRIEKLLHFLVLCQLGCRFESVATIFSRTPRQILESSLEAIESLNTLWIESIRPEKYDEAPVYFLYSHLWRIVGYHHSRTNVLSSVGYYPWSYQELCRAVVALNVFIGRYRSQGRVSLTGEIYDWGRYVARVQNDGLHCAATTTERGLSTGLSIWDAGHSDTMTYRR